ncbi:MULTISPECIES: CU044_2847 family protein [Cyanophyceae]|uniref:Trypsin-co-occurring domain-containing protein n=1 Tax=Leptolyngbya subtilissima DQ-A4 TaxID=2933933 RepID=A0ABV0K0U3_9CYAN|nr:CU044_2847 family protein [Nodosilinea sp. FACHB-141]MBD2112222.1 hypothetical protein [Nodosilinea sp. FACHB-141]
MTTIQPIVLEDDDGTSYTIYVETDVVETNSRTATPPAVPPSPPPSPRSYDPNATRETYSWPPSEPTRGLSAPINAQLQTVHQTIRAYTVYALGAFKNLAGAEVEDLKLSFGIKINADTGIPMLAKGSIDGDFKIEVTCKFPKN